MRKNTGLRFTIGTKLVGLIAVMLILTVVTIVWKATRMFISDNTDLIQKMNVDTVAHFATRMRENLEGLSEKMRVVGAMMAKSSGEREAVVKEMFANDKDFLLFALFELTTSGDASLKDSAASPELARAGDGKGQKAIATLKAEKSFSFAQLEKGEIQVTSFKLHDGTWAVAVGLPLIQRASASDRFSHATAAIVRQNRFMKAFAESDIVTSYMIDRRGNLIAHPDSSLTEQGENLAHLDIVKECLSGKFNNRQTEYVEPQSKEARLGAFRLVGFGGLGVVSEVPKAKAMEAAKRVEYRSILLGIVVLSMAFLFGYLYSRSITSPIKQLVVVSERIKTGDFKINLVPKTNDEIADLSLAFNDMARGLEERDRVKATFAKFHNPEIAEKLLSGEVKLGGERKQATIFFSDIRGFTHLSETMAPEQVVDLLNEYMTQMVSIIRRYGGVVDKYVGDAIMALWGVPLEQPGDAENAVRACLAMRSALVELNQKRLERGQPALYIGMGLNRGQVIAGNIGSDEKMEYTVIGDSVNVASRIESMTKEFGTDLLVAESIQASLADRFVFEACTDVRVKGKSGALKLFKVSGYTGEDGKRVTVETAYSSYRSQASDKSVKQAA